jgi:DNA-binding NarL/FixJ family response regulator
MSVSRRRILIVDDHPVVRQGLSMVIDGEPDLMVCGSAANIEEALRLAEEEHPDAVIIDLSLDGQDGIELIDYIKSRWPSVKILVYSAHDEETFAGRVIRAGAMGYISKRESIPQIGEAIRKILGGEVYLSRKMTTQLLLCAAVGRPLDRNPLEMLSNRELQVFELVGRGMNTMQIANGLEISPGTVDTHRKAIKTKLNLRTSAELSRRAFQWVQENS